MNCITRKRDREGKQTMLNDYRNKFVTPEAAAAKAVRSGDWVDYGFGAGFPELLDRALAGRKEELKDVKIRGGLVIRPRIEAVECDPEQSAFTYYSWHIGDYERKLQSRGLCRFIPMILRSLPELYRNHIRVDVAFVPVSTPDDNGYCGLGVSNYAWRTIFEKARTVVFEINEHLPRLQGVDGSHRVHLSEADFIVEGEHEPLPLRTYREPSPTDIEIARHVVNEIPDGAVLSLGVGGVPFTVARMLAESDLKDLGCHTGTISDAFLALYKAGKLTNKRKEFDAGYSTWNLAMGSQELYNWLDEEPELFHPGDVDYVHSPERISRMKNVISINGGVELDLMGQENAESAGSRQLSGTGGQLDFLEGAFRSEGGKGFICLASTHKKKDGTLKSNIVPFVPGGSVVSAPRSMIQYVATEYGVAKLSGLSLRERAEAMTAIAHPDFREELMKYARENFL
ncbi:acetyl-CoA hydrolase/transferase C-terminal domain-containing protein [uncultured Clostridium sp.]|uniref:acetyl-CoA hydrolase/transferase family protein n=1 Tax=uncultured Clostridium sp. TaxID=59620 RepID=UPI003458C2CB